MATSISLAATIRTLLFRLLLLLLLWFVVVVAVMCGSCRRRRNCSRIFSKVLLADRKDNCSRTRNIKRMWEGETNMILHTETLIDFLCTISSLGVEAVLIIELNMGRGWTTLANRPKYCSGTVPPVYCCWFVCTPTSASTYDFACRSVRTQIVTGNEEDSSVYDIGKTHKNEWNGANILEINVFYIEKQSYLSILFGIFGVIFQCISNLYTVESFSFPVMVVRTYVQTVS